MRTLRLLFLAASLVVAAGCSSHRGTASTYNPEYGNSVYGSSGPTPSGTGTVRSGTKPGDILGPNALSHPLPPPSPGPSVSPSPINP